MATEALPPVDTSIPTPADAVAPVLASAPPDAPRPVTPRVRRRAWTEPHVRFWWLLTLAMLVIGVYVCGREFLTWSREARLVREGRVVEAEVTRAGGLSSRLGHRLPPNTVVTIQYEVDGKTYQQDGYLSGRKDYIQVHGKVPIRVDPADPSDWTARTEPPVLAQQLTGAAVVLPAVVVLAVVALLRRVMTLRTWRHGQATVALTVESRQTALAPRSRLVRCAPADRGDNRVVGVFVPSSAARDLRPGDLLWLVFPPGGRGRPVAAAWFNTPQASEVGGE